MKEKEISIFDSYKIFLSLNILGFLKTKSRAMKKLYS